MTNNDNKPPVSVSGNNNVVSIGQTGGVTAGTYINQVPQPQLKLLNQKDLVNLTEHTQQHLQLKFYRRLLRRSWLSI